MLSIPRLTLRWTLKQLVLLAKRKHKPAIIAIIGSGQTTIAKELIFAVINSKYPARQNSEKPEAEFSVPLTTLGYPNYPKNYFEWLWALLRASLQIVFLKPYSHFLILELDTVNDEIQQYWLNTLSPETVVTALPGTIESYKQMAVRIGTDYDIDEDISSVILEDWTFPSSRIRFIKGQSGSLIIDNTHYYYPNNLNAVLEIIREMDGNKIVITENQGDIKYLAQSPLGKDLTVNPGNYSANSGDIVILRGPRTKVFRHNKELLIRP